MHVIVRHSMWFVVFLLSSSALYGLDLVVHGDAAATIVVPDAPGDVATRAAAWIRDYVQQSTGADLAIVNESAAPGGALIAVGHTALAAKAGIGTEDLRWDGCRVVVRGNVLYLIGRDTLTELQRERWSDGRRVTREAGAGAQGTAQAATTFLERFCGVRWFVPGPNGAVVPSATDLSVPDDTDILFQPAFAFLHGRYVYGSQLGPAAIANNNRTAIRLCTFGGHSWPAWMPASVYHDDHPEYYALRGGTRPASHAGHLCTTNPEVRQILLREIRRRFDAGFDWVQLGQSDGYRRCQCDACEALDRYRGRAGELGLSTDEWLYTYLKHNPCERIHRLHHWIAERCADSHPGKTVHLLVYSSSVMPPKTIADWPANTVGEVCDIDPRVIVEWGDKPRAKTTYMCWFLIAWRGVGYGVMVTPRQISERIRYLREHDFIGIYLCGGGGNWGLQGPTYYTMGKMVGNPALDYRQLTEEYCRGMYGAAADEMLDFYTTLYTRESDILMYNYFNRDQASPGDRLMSMYPPELLNDLERRLQAAEAAADSERSRRWVRFTRDHFDLVRLTCQVMAAHRAYQVRPTAENLSDIEHHVNAFEDYRDRIVSYSTEHIEQWFPGYMKLYTFLTSDGSYAAARAQQQPHPPERRASGFRGTAVGFRNFTIREPFTWDFRLVHDYPFLAAGSAPDSAAYRDHVASLEAGAEQLAANPSFEVKGPETMPEGWGHWVKHGIGTMRRVTGEGRTGGACMVYDGMKRGGVHRRVKLTPGQYVGIAFVRAPETLNPRARVTINVSGRTADDTELKKLSRRTEDLPAGDWVALSVYGSFPAAVNGRDLTKALFIVTVDNLAPGEKLNVDDMMLFRVNE